MACKLPWLFTQVWSLSSCHTGVMTSRIGASYPDKPAVEIIDFKKGRISKLISLFHGIGFGFGSPTELISLLLSAPSSGGTSTVAVGSSVGAGMAVSVGGGVAVGVALGIGVSVGCSVDVTVGVMEAVRVK